MAEQIEQTDYQEPLERLFEEVRQTYFPRWRRGKGWSVRYAVPPGRPKAHGYCDPQTCTIWISPRTVDEPSDTLVIIHEVTHALTNQDRGVCFQRRLQKAAEDAEHQGNPSLATELRQEVQFYAESPPIRAEYMYNEIRGYASECDNYERLLRWLSEESGLLPEEFEKKFRRARRVFEKERIEIEEGERFAAAARLHRENPTD
jgi:hypothetical protein